jgi:predicted nucleic acid-binding protein
VAGILIDTSVLVDAERDNRVLEQLPVDARHAISVITVSELLHGVHRATGARRARRTAFVEHLLAGLEPIPVTEPVARVHADVWAQLVQAGRVVGAHDLWIGATALAHGLGVATRNVADFERIPGLRVIAA